MGGYYHTKFEGTRSHGIGKTTDVSVFHQTSQDTNYLPLNENYVIQTGMAEIMLHTNIIPAKFHINQKYSF